MSTASNPQKPATAKPPAGFDVGKAKTLAPQVLADLQNAVKKAPRPQDRGGYYNRGLLKTFQVAAGIAADGLYGGGARGALIFYGIANPPEPFFKPTATAPYPWTPYIAKQLGVQPASKAAEKTAVKPLSSGKPAPVAASTLAGKTPPKGFDPVTAKKLAPQVNTDLVNKGRDKYSHALLRSFQVAAGIAADGLYGGGARGALIFYGVKNPPAPFFKPTATAPYPWAGYLAKTLNVKAPPATGKDHKTGLMVPKAPAKPATPAKSSGSNKAPSKLISPGKGKPASGTSPRTAPANDPKTRPDPFAAPSQVDEYIPGPGANAPAAGPAYSSGGTSSGGGLATTGGASSDGAESEADAGAGANAADSATAPASGGTSGIAVAVGIATAIGLGLYVAKKSKRRAHAAHH